MSDPYTRAAIAAATTLPTRGEGYEQRRAIMEGERNASAERFFGGDESPSTLRKYDVAFTHGWDRAEAIADTRLEVALRALRSLEVSANTVARCYTHNPGNFAQALTSLEADAKAARELVAALEK